MDAERITSGSQDFSSWTATDREGPAKLVPVNPPMRLGASGVPIIEQSHEYVMPKRNG